MKLTVNVQYAARTDGLPRIKEIRSWIQAALQGRRPEAVLCVRIVDEEEGTRLNTQWRKHKAATNVLSFPYDGVDGIAPEVLGDIVICAPVVMREAQQQNKKPAAHWAHMVVHGTLHLIGLDHLEESDAQEMERLEAAILAKLGYPDPYKPAHDS